MGVWIDRDDVGVEEAGAFPAIAEANAGGGLAGPCGEAAAEEALEVERGIRSEADGEFFQPAGEIQQTVSTAELFTGEGDGP